MVHSLYALSCVILPCLIYQVIKVMRLPHKPKYLANHIVWVYIFLLYIHMVFEATGIAAIWEIGRYGDIIRLEEINFIPFQSEGAMTYVLNAFMFMPLGFLLPLIWKSFRKIQWVFLTGAGFSLAIEFCQLFNRRRTDIDDLMMNTLGAIIGYFIWKIGGRLIGRLLGKTQEKDVMLSKAEPVIYLILATGGMFLLFDWRLPLRIMGY